MTAWWRLVEFIMWAGTGAAILLIILSIALIVVMGSSDANP